MAKKSKVAMLLADEWRTRIEVGKLITRLQRNANDELDKEMTAGQLKSAELLLRKALPDLSAVAVTGAQDGPVQITVRWKEPE